jgi:hypothetical protein
MRPAGEPSLVSFDATGATIAAALLLLGSWYGLLRPSAARAELTRLNADMELRRKDLVALERESAGFTSTLQKLESELASAGAPPAKSPIEEDLRTITELMRRHGLHVSEVSPIGSTAYPGVQESRYRVRARGHCAEISATLRDFEGCRFWGDITSLQVQVAGAGKTLWAEGVDVEMTVSFYSAEGGSPTGSDGK